MYSRDGFLHVPALLDAGELREIDLALNAYRQLIPQLAPGDLVLEADGASVRNFWRMERYSAFFAALARRPKIVELVGPLVNGTPVSMGVELFAKPARVGSAVPFHQDNAYFNLTPPDALTCWIALDRSTEENGCVRFIAGSHTNGVLPHEASGVRGNSYGLADPPPPGTSEVTALLEPGDAMLHHCCTIHRSEPNRSERPRRGLLLVYKAAHCAIDEEGQRRYQQAARAIQ